MGLGPGSACFQTGSQGLGRAGFKCSRRGSGVGLKALPTLAQGWSLSLLRPWSLLPENRPDDPCPAPGGRDRAHDVLGGGFGWQRPQPSLALPRPFGSSCSLPNPELQASSRHLWAAPCSSSSSRPSPGQLWASAGRQASQQPSYYPGPIQTLSSGPHSLPWYGADPSPCLKLQ